MPGDLDKNKEEKKSEDKKDKPKISMEELEKIKKDFEADKKDAEKHK